MKNLVLMLDPSKLENPDLDLRYVIPDLLSARSDGGIKDGGYDYETQENQSAPVLSIFLTTTNLPVALEHISQLVLDEEVLGNNLSSAATLYIEKDGSRSQVLFGQDHA